MKVVHPFLFLSEQDWYFSETELHCPFLLKYKKDILAFLILSTPFLCPKKNHEIKIYEKQILLRMMNFIRNFLI